MLGVDLLLLWLISIFSPKEQRPNTESEDLGAFFFGTAPWGEDNSKPINEDYDQGPDW